MKALVPEDLPRIRRAVEAEHRRSLMRCISAIALGALQHRTAESVVRENWRSDAVAAEMTRAATMPMTTADSGLPTFTATRLLASLAPSSAASRLFGRAAVRLDFEGVHQYSIPFSGSMPEPVFVEEGKPARVVQGDLDAMTVGPTCKLMFICPISGTLETYSVEAATSIIGSMMSDSASKALDRAVFSDVAADAARPAGLLNGVTPETATAGGGMAALIGDMKKLVSKIAEKGLDADDAIFVAHPTQAVALRLLAPQPFAQEVYSSVAVDEGTVIAIVPGGVATGYAGQPEIYVSKSAAVHFEDTAPSNIGNPGAPTSVAAPVVSSFQADLLLLKLRTRCAWAARPGAVQYIEGATW